MGPALVMARIVLPQVALTTAPAIVNQFTVIVKSSTLVSVITVQDLMFQSQKLVNVWYEPIEILTATAAIYIAFVFAVSACGKRLSDALRARAGQRKTPAGLPAGVRYRAMRGPDYSSRWPVSEMRNWKIATKLMYRPSESITAILPSTSVPAYSRYVSLMRWVSQAVRPRKTSRPTIETANCRALEPRKMFTIDARNTTTMPTIRMVPSYERSAFVV